MKGGKNEETVSHHSLRPFVNDFSQSKLEFTTPVESLLREVRSMLRLYGQDSFSNFENR